MTLDQIKGAKVAIHCQTKEESKRVTDILKSSLNMNTVTDRWDSYKEKTCYRITKIGLIWFEKLSFYELESYTIIPAAQFILANPNV